MEIRWCIILFNILIRLIAQHINTCIWFSSRHTTHPVDIHIYRNIVSVSISLLCVQLLNACMINGRNSIRMQYCIRNGPPEINRITHNATQWANAQESLTMPRVDACKIGVCVYALIPFCWPRICCIRISSADWVVNRNILIFPNNIRQQITSVQRKQMMSVTATLRQIYSNRALIQPIILVGCSELQCESESEISRNWHSFNNLSHVQIFAAGKQCQQR